MDMIRNFIMVKGGFLLLIVSLTIGFSCKKKSSQPAAEEAKEVQVKFIISS